MVLKEAVAARGLAALANRSYRRMALAIVVALVIASCEASDPTAPIPAPPALTSPTSGQILDNGCPGCSDPMKWAFKWAEVGDATQYHLHVMADSATIPIINDQAVPFAQYFLTDQGYVTVPGAWRWRVRVLVKGKWSDWSETRTFTVEPSCQDCPTAPSPTEKRPLRRNTFAGK